MNTQAKQRIVAASGWAISALAILGVSTLLVTPEHRTPYFWQRILWAQFLAALVWAFVGGFVSNALLGRKAPRAEGGILPAFGFVVTAYAALSAILMLLHAFVPENDFLNRFHLAGQIVLMALAGTVCVFLNISRTAAAHGIEPMPDGVRSPAELGALLRAEESRLVQGGKQNDAESLASVLKTLRERIQYTLPHVGEIGTRSDYKVFAAAVEKVCQKVAVNSRVTVPVENQSNALAQEVSDLALKVELIADGLKRR